MKNIIIIICLFGQLQIFAQEKLKLVVSASIFQDMAYNIAKDKVDIKSIVPIGGDPHLHEPIPRDAQIVSDADVIFINGLNFEGWIKELIENSGTRAEVVTITEGVEAIRSLVYKDSADPHAWMSASNGLIYVENMTKALAKADPANSAYYEQNAKAYKSEIEQLHNAMIDQVNTIPREKRVLITSHDAFQYYGRAYGLKLEAIMGISTEAEAQTSDMVRVNKAIQAYSVPAIFIESTINPAMIKQIAKDNDIIIGGELFADSLGEKESEAGTYLGMLKHNTETIVKALRDSTPNNNSEQMSEGNSGGWLTYVIVGGVLLLGLGIVIIKMNS